jgi:hypothetical protein
MIPAVEKVSVDGVTVLRSDSASGRNTAALVFRVGRFDETLPTAGITHLIEHLAFSGKPKASYQFNAEVTGRFTTFFMESADAGDTADFVTTVCRGLAGDYREALDREKRILRTEAASRGGAGALGTCLGERYGATGPGLGAYEEFGLRRLDWAEIDAWRRRWFAVGNAVLWIHGAIPPELRIDLPYGPSPAASPLRSLAPGLPGFVVAGRGSIGMSLVGAQSVVAAVSLDILQNRLTQVLRHERGLSYGVKAASEQLDGDLAHTWLEADALPDQTSMVAHTMLATFESLAEDGSTSEEVTDYAQRLRSAYESPGGPMMVLHRHAQNILSARPTRDPGDTLRAVSQVDGHAVGQAAKGFLGQMIMATPQLVPAVQGRMPRLPVWSAETITGTDLRSQASGLTLTFGDEGVMLTAEPGQHVTVRSGAVAALLRWKDQKRTLIGTDGFALHIDPADYPGGDAVVRSIEASVDPRLTVDIDSIGPDRPQRDGPSAETPHAVAPAVREEKVTPRLGWLSRIIRVVWVAVMIFGALAMAGGDIGGGVVFVVIGLVGIAGQQLRIRRRNRRLGQAAGRG